MKPLAIALRVVGIMLLAAFFLLGGLAAAAALIFEWKRPLALIVAALILFGLRWLYIRRRSGGLRPVREAALVNAAVLALSLYSLGAHYFLSTARDCDIDLLGVRPIHYIEHCGDPSCMAYSSNVYGLTTGGGYLISTNSGLAGSSLAFTDLGKRKSPFIVGFAHYGPQRLYYDEDRDHLVAGLWGRPTILVIRTDPIELVKRFSVDRSKLIDIDYYDGAYYVLSESKKVYIIDADELTVTGREIDAVCGTLYSLRVNRSTGKAYISDWMCGFLYKLDARTMELEKRRFMGPSMFGLDIDHENDEVLLARPLRSRILALDGGSLRTKRAVGAGFGVRDILLDEDRKLHSANYFSGSYSRIDYETGVTEHEVEIGKFARGVYKDPGSGRVYAASHCGVFEIK